jgi:hypothetical protein
LNYPNNRTINYYVGTPKLEIVRTSDPNIETIDKATGEYKFLLLNSTFPTDLDPATRNNMTGSSTGEWMSCGKMITYGHGMYYLRYGFNVTSQEGTYRGYTAKFNPNFIENSNFNDPSKYGYFTFDMSNVSNPLIKDYLRKQSVESFSYVDSNGVNQTKDNKIIWNNHYYVY